MRDFKGALGNKKSSGGKSIRRHRKAAWLFLAVAPIATALTPRAAMSQTLTWDASGAHPTNPTDGSGNWNTASSLWTSGGASDVVWTNGESATFGNLGTAGTININTTG